MNEENMKQKFFPVFAKTHPTARLGSGKHNVLF